MNAMRLLDLFCKAGGTTRGYQLAGFHVTGVDIESQPNYVGDEFIQADALTFPLDGFDVIHASPPCQAYSVLGSRYDRAKHPDLIGAVRERLIGSGACWVIENVLGAPLRNPVMLCGSSFELGVRRHRHFECSFPMMVSPCAHGFQPKKYRIYEHGRWFMSSSARVFGNGGGKAKDQWGEAMGIDWMTPAELREAIPPAYTEFIGSQLLTQLAKR